MGKKEKSNEVVKAVKEPKTIKQSTVIVSMLVVAAIFASFIAGWHLHQTHDNYIEGRISTAVSDLKVSE